MNVTVVGMGKIGLPLAVQCARKGHRVFGVDIDPEVLHSIASGVAPFPGEPGLAEGIRDMVATGLLTARADTEEAVRGSDAIVVVVPLSCAADGEPDFDALDSATRAVGHGLRRDALVAFETTLPVGTTRDRLLPILEASSGLAFDREFSVVFSPERVLSGRVFEDLARYPKLVGGVSPASEKRGVEFYETILDFAARPDLDRPNGVWSMGSSEAAELAKLAETTYRDVNIALANQFALFAESNGMDIHPVIAASNSQPYSHIHQPGIAVGGHCIPVYPRLYLWNDPGASVVATARQANEAMPEAVLHRIESDVGSLKEMTVLLLGAAYRGGVKEAAFSGAFALASRLEGLGAVVTVHDPIFDDRELSELGFTPFPRGGAADVVILQADHEEYRAWGPQDVVGVRYFFDGRAWTRASRWPGVRHRTLGRAAS